jgi:ABC-type uncharacterized transport system substrate-binding protein
VSMARDIGRRALIGLAGVAVTVLPLSASVARQALPVLGFLSGTSPDLYAPFLAAFRAGLTEAGFVDGQNVTIEYRWAEGKFDRLPAMADELVRDKVDVIVTSGGILAALAAKKATDTIPTVFLAGDDPVRIGLVANLAHPGGNRTGISFLVVDLNVKRLELLSELVPQAKTIALIVNPRNANASARIVREVQQAAAKKRLHIDTLEASSAAEIEAAFATLTQHLPDALLIGNDAFFNAERNLFIALAARAHLPASYESSDAVRAGGLISYGPNIPAMYRQLGAYVGRVLGGAKPADLPVEQPTRFELVVNLKTAKSLDLVVPQSILARADEVVE